MNAATRIFLAIVALPLLCLSGEARAATNRVSIAREGCCGGWIFSMPKNPGEIWSIQGNRTLAADDWFNIPNITDHGTNVTARVPADTYIFARGKRIK